MNRNLGAKPRSRYKQTSQSTVKKHKIRLGDVMIALQLAGDVRYAFGLTQCNALVS